MDVIPAKSLATKASLTALFRAIMSSLTLSKCFNLLNSSSSSSCSLSLQPCGVSKQMPLLEEILVVVRKRVSPLREGWGDWFDKKSDFLRRDQMFKSNLESLNPLNNLILQDPLSLGFPSIKQEPKPQKIPSFSRCIEISMIIDTIRSIRIDKFHSFLKGNY